jgi:hypothetical protein
MTLFRFFGRIHTDAMPGYSIPHFDKYPDSKQEYQKINGYEYYCDNACHIIHGRQVESNEQNEKVNQ